MRVEYATADIAMKTFTKQFVEIKQQVCPDDAKARKQTACKANSSGAAYPKRLPRLSEADHWSSQHTLSTWLPPDDSRLYKDTSNRRWQLFWTRTRKTRSFSFQAYSVAGGAQRALILAWEEWQRLGGTPPPFSLDISSLEGDIGLVEAASSGG